MANELPHHQLQRVLRNWRDNLIDLSGRNRLLNFRHSPTATLTISEPSVQDILAGLASGWTFAELPGDGDEENEDAPIIIGDDGLVTQKTTQVSLNRALRKLYRDSNQVFNDTGLWTLQMGVGFLKWREDGAAAFNSAPLLLVPVRLERTELSDFRLIAEDDEDTLPNPALAVKMAQLGLAWPAADDMKDLADTLAAIRRAVAGQGGWQVTEDVVLATFRSHKEAMYRDLLDNEEQMLSHPMVQAIGLGPRAELPRDVLDFDPADVNRIDDLQPPELTPLVLDADSSQRQCVAAALDGRSFVMDGPPGTGKSQTIANMIAALMHAGRSVLFVSEKAAALDVVRNRLDAVGLGSFLLSLHSHHATRKQVAIELGEALLHQPRAVHTSSDEDKKRVKNLRGQLTAYANAMNEIRQPLNRSLHDVIGRLSTMAVAPLLPAESAEALDPEMLHEILAAAEMIGDSWRPASEGEDFVWRGLKAGASPHPKLSIVGERTERLKRRLERHTSLTAPLSLEDLGDADRVIALLDATANRPTVPTQWLTVPDLDSPRTAVADFSVQLEGLRGRAAGLASEIGPEWDLLPSWLSSHVPPTEHALAELTPEGLDPSILTGDQARGLAADFTATAAMLSSARATLADIAAALGMPVPQTLDQALELCELTDFGRAAHRPETAWLNTDDRTAAHQAALELETRLTAVAQARAAASDLFSEKVLTASDLPEVALRFTEVHGLSKLSGGHRTDKRFLADLTVSGEWHKSVAERLPQAVAWHEASVRLQQTITAHSATLGQYWNSGNTDFVLIRKLLGVAERITVLTRHVQDPRALAWQVCANGTPNPAICEAAATASGELSHWRTQLVPAPQPGGRPRLSHLPLADVSAWYSTHIAPLEAAAELVATVQPICTHASALTVSEVRHVVEQINDVRKERAAFHGRETDDRILLGPLYGALETDIAALDDALGWVTSVRMDKSPMPIGAAEALLAANPDHELRNLRDGYATAVEQFIELFAKDRQKDLRDGLTGSLTSVRHLTKRLAADQSGPEEWHSFRSGHATLRRHGLGDLVDRAAEQHIDGGVFRDAVERAVLQSWVEHQLATDRRLTIVRAVQRDKLIAEFRKLDKALVGNAHAQVIEACNARRPRPNVGQAAILQHEAQKKTRHMPVRTLLEKTADVVPLLKPCFMMSPLTVSQFLPPGYRFDVVIFDEASQVLPQDAINCVYRGDGLIVAGDQKQLPPTNFFAQSEEIDEEYDEDAPDSYESLLDMCKASGLIRSLSLRWHYRSRHESLIAFSNSEFYRRELVTFPGAHQSGDNVGVTFSKVPGVYERGRSRQNPVEAEAVAERVMHHYTTRPGLSLGVVAMSDAQAHAVEDAVEVVRQRRPDLDHFFNEDRLNGFFVKNLETVQGDERDVIILSVGYGPDQDGKLTMAFGPLNRENGWRRLNVAVTRARNRVEVVASMSGGDIRESDNTSRNHFKRYLDYAERGPGVLSLVPISDDAAPESPFEESVLDVLLGWGYEVQPQVGVGGYRIDMAVRHPEAPGRYAIGIECDGAMYHSSKAARDRDRLREEVLRGLGWDLHRIWGTDWYRHQSEAEQRLREAIETAVARPISSPRAGPILESADLLSTATAIPAAESPAVPRVTMEVVSIEAEPEWAVPYKRSRVEQISWYELHEPEASEQILRVFLRVLETEAPIHYEVLYRRVAEAWSAVKIGSRIRRNLDQVLANLERKHPDVLREGDVLTLRGRPVIPRFPADQVPRKVTEIPPSERRQALLGVLGESPGIAEAELLKEVASFFGWQRRGPDITRLLTEDLRELVAQHLIEGRPHRIVRR